MGDITEFKGDTIVNATNPRMLHGGGVCGAIYDAIQRAGKEHYRMFLYELSLIQKIDMLGNKLTYGTTKVTSAPGLGVRYIYHTLGANSNHHPDLIQQKKIIFSCYYSCLMTAVKMGIRSIAFPLISAGFYGCSKQIVAESLSLALRHFKRNFPSSNLYIYLFIRDQDDRSLF